MIYLSEVQMSTYLLLLGIYLFIYLFEKKWVCCWVPLLLLAYSFVTYVYWAQKKNDRMSSTFTALEQRLAIDY